MCRVHQVAQRDEPMESLKPSVDLSLVRSAFKSLLAREEEDLPEGLETDLGKIFAGTQDDFEKQHAYALRLGTSLASALDGHAFFNGKHVVEDDVRPASLPLSPSPSPRPCSP